MLQKCRMICLVAYIIMWVYLPKSESVSYTHLTSSSRYATGYTVTADYTGEVAKPDCDVVTYTAIFGSTQASEGTAKSSVSLSAVKIPLLAGGTAIALTAGGVFVFQKIKKRR